MDIIIYHSNCPDGYGCAWIHKFLHPDTHTSIPATPQNIALVSKKIISEYPNTTSITICDISFDRSAICAQKFLEAFDSEVSVTLIDHHCISSATENLLRNLKSQYKKRFKYILNKNKSSSYTYYRSFSDTLTGLGSCLISYINENDLGIQKLPYSREVGCFLKHGGYTYDYDFFFAVEYELQTLTEESFIVQQGLRILEDIKSYARSKMKKISYLLFFNNIIPAVETKKYRNEICRVILDEFKEAPFCAAYNYTKDYVVVSLRSRGVFDVNKIAQKFGGGGHKYASAFTVRKQVFTKTILLSNYGR